MSTKTTTATKETKEVNAITAKLAASKARVAIMSPVSIPPAKSRYALSAMAKEELATRVKAMTKEEQLITIMHLPDTLLQAELKRRIDARDKIIQDMRAAMNGISR